MNPKWWVVTVKTGDNKEHECVYHIQADNMWGALVRFGHTHTFARVLAKEISVTERVGE